jgi:hypothetical protein
MSKEPRKVIVKTMTVNRDSSKVFDFFENVKNWETGGALRNITKGNDGWWTFQTPVGSAKVKLRPNKELLTLDHDFVGSGITWDVYSRIIPNSKGSTTIWTFVCPDNMKEDQFEEQLRNFDMEIKGWKKSLES